jgi:hypothetical protein
LVVPDVIDRVVGRVPRHWRIVLAIVTAALALNYHANATLNRSLVQGRGDVALADVRDAGYYPAKAWLHGVNPYDPVAFRAFNANIGQDFPLYSPLHIALHLPLAPLTREGARETFYWLSLGLVAVLAALALRVGGRRPTFETTAVCFAGVLVTHPGALSLISGQTGPLLAIGGALALVGSVPLAAPLGIALALSKPTFGVPLVAVVLARGRTRPALIGAAVGTVVSLVMALRLVIANGFTEFVDGVADGLHATARIGSGKRVDAASTIARLLDIEPPLIFEIVSALVLGGIACWVIHLVTRRFPTSDLGLLLAFLTPPLLLFHGSWDLITLIPAFVLALRPDPARVLTDRLRWGIVALLLYALVNPASTRFADAVYSSRLRGILGMTVRSLAVGGAWTLALVAGLMAIRGAARAAVATSIE